LERSIDELIQRLHLVDREVTIHAPDRVSCRAGNGFRRHARADHNYHAFDGGLNVGHVDFRLNGTIEAMMPDVAGDSDYANPRSRTATQNQTQPPPQSGPVGPELQRRRAV